jgi:3-hydroxyisobutyrate dehydrogenase-like beta-hydroxyacid dehydrogenase
MTRVGFIGLGSQGGPMARQIVDAGFPLTIWARRSQTVEPFAGTGATIAASPAEVGAASDLVGICVVADADVEQVAHGVLDGMAAGGIIAIHSTVHPDTCRRLASRATARGVTVIDAPVSGGGMAATEHRLLVMTGGDGAVERCRPVFETFAGTIVHLGPVGSGQLGKLLNNLVFTAQIAVAIDTFAFADRLGVDRAALAQVLAKGSGASFAAALVGASETIAGLRGAAPLLRKDLDLSYDVARLQGAAPPEVLAGLAESALRSMEPERS